MTETHGFGGSWTEEKLKRVEKYLKAYATIMNKQNFRFAYIGILHNSLKVVYTFKGKIPQKIWFVRIAVSR